MSSHQSIRMPFQYDIVVETADGTCVLVVECKRMKVTSAVQAAELRRSLQAHSRALSPAFFMLAFHTGIFMWRAEAASDAQPEFSAAAKPVLTRYLGAVADRPGGPLPESLEIAISSWLSDLVSGIREPDLDSEPERMVVESGLLAKIKGGIVRTRIAA